jgi:hypothetical protein
MIARPVIALAQRSTARFASLAVCAICQTGRPNRSASNPPTAATSADGSMQVRPWPACRCKASVTAGGECPNIAPVSPRQKSA